MEGTVERSRKHHDTMLYFVHGKKPPFSGRRGGVANPILFFLPRILGAHTIEGLGFRPM